MTPQNGVCFYYCSIFKIYQVVWRGFGKFLQKNVKFELISLTGFAILEYNLDSKKTGEVSHGNKA